MAQVSKRRRRCALSKDCKITDLKREGQKSRGGRLKPMEKIHLSTDFAGKVPERESRARIKNTPVGGGERGGVQPH